MRNSIVLSALLCATATLAQIPGEALTGTAGNTTIAGSNAGPDKDGKYTIEGVGIRATFIPYGASISNLFINDTSGIERDIVGGFDNASYYGVVSTLISEKGTGGDRFAEEKTDDRRTANILTSVVSQAATQTGSRTAVS
jgi:hypothetical protein